MPQQPVFVWKLTGKMPDPYSGDGTLYGNLAKKHMEMSQEPFCVEINKKNAARQFRGARFAWKFKTHMDMSQKPFCAESD